MALILDPDLLEDSAADDDGDGVYAEGSDFDRRTTLTFVGRFTKIGDIKNV